MTQIYRYPGAQPFQSDQRDVFFGREKDIDNLHELITLEQLVVLYSKSGLGKSSLLNAGVLPRFEQEPNIQIQSLRFGAHTDETEETPLSITRHALTQAPPSTEVLDKLIPGEGSLWYWLKSHQFAGAKDTFLLFFDQFEELFTYPEAEIVAFKRQLAELINTDIPPRFRTFIEQQYEKGKVTLTDEELEMIHQPIEVKVVIAIRSDRLSLLNNLNDYLPNVLRVCYELEPLDRTQAEEAIINPAFKKGAQFISPPFDYEDAALDKILDFLTHHGTEKIESFQLQILCQTLEQKIVDQNLDRIGLSEVENLESIYENYYDNQIALLENEEDRRAARRLIEEGLIFEEEERRLSIYEGQIYKSFGFTPELLRKLVDVRLLRSEPSLKGGYTYELCHDTMVAPILKAKRQRLEEERRLAEEAERQWQEATMQALRDKAAKERRQRNQARLVAAIAIFFAIAATAASAWAIRANNKLQESYSLIEQQNEQLNQQIIALIEADYERLLAEGRQFQSEARFEEAIRSYDQALAVIGDYQQIDQGGQQAKEAKAEAEQVAEEAAQYTSLMAEGDAFYARGEASYRDALLKFQAARDLNIDDNFNTNAQNKIDRTRIAINQAFEKHRDRARLFLQENNLDLACRSFRIARSLKPGDPFLQEMPAQCN